MGETVTADRPTGGDASGNAPRAVAVALGLGLLGPAIALASALLVGGINAVVGLSVLAALALTLFFGQYVAFAGLSLVYLRGRGFDWSRVRSYLGVRRPSLLELGIVVVGWVTILIMVMGISLIVQLVGAEPGANQTAELAVENPAVFPLLFVAMFLVVGPCEEILYRGVVQGRLREAMGPVPAIVIAAAVFAFVHVMAVTGGAVNRLTTVAILFVPSLVFGAVYEYTENIVVPSLLHGLHNAVLIAILWVTVTYADEFEELAEAGLLLPF